MRNKFWKRIAAVGLAAAMAVTTLAGCGGDGKDDKKGGSDADKTKFTWWIYQIDGEGNYYQVY